MCPGLREHHGCFRVPWPSELFSYPRGKPRTAVYRVGFISFRFIRVTKRSGLPVLHCLIPEGCLQSLRKYCQCIKLAWRIQTEHNERTYCIKRKNTTFPMAKYALSVFVYFLEKWIWQWWISCFFSKPLTGHCKLWILLYITTRWLNKCQLI